MTNSRTAPFSTSSSNNNSSNSNNSSTSLRRRRRRRSSSSSSRRVALKDPSFRQTVSHPSFTHNSLSSLQELTDSTNVLYSSRLLVVSPSGSLDLYATFVLHFLELVVTIFPRSSAFLSSFVCHLFPKVNLLKLVSSSPFNPPSQMDVLHVIHPLVAASPCEHLYKRQLAWK